MSIKLQPFKPEVIQGLASTADRWMHGLKLLQLLDFYTPVNTWTSMRTVYDWECLVLATLAMATSSKGKYSVVYALLDAATFPGNGCSVSSSDIKELREAIDHAYAAAHSSVFKSAPYTPELNDYHITRCYLLGFPRSSVEYFNSLYSLCAVAPQDFDVDEPHWRGTTEQVRSRQDALVTATWALRSLFTHPAHADGPWPAHRAQFSEFDAYLRRYVEIDTKTGTGTDTVQ